MINWTSVKDSLPKGFVRVVFIIDYPQERFCREGFWDSDNNKWFTESHSGRCFQVMHPDAVVTHWSYINMPCKIPGFETENPNICPTCGKANRK